MTNTFALRQMCAEYDRGRLVPFIGSGMSIPACVSWSTFVANLERTADIALFPAVEHGSLMQRASVAMQQLRLGHDNTVAAIKSAVYSQHDTESTSIPEQTKALAQSTGSYAHGGRIASVSCSSPSAHSAIASARRGSAPA